MVFWRHQSLAEAIRNPALDFLVLRAGGYVMCSAHGSSNWHDRARFSVILQSFKFIRKGLDAEVGLGKMYPRGDPCQCLRPTVQDTDQVR